MEVEVITESLLPWIEDAEILISLGAVGAILGGFLLSGLRFLSRSFLKRAGAYQAFRSELARTLMLSLEILVVADVIRTITLDQTLASVGVLAAMIAVRTLISWSIALELDGPCLGRRRTRPSSPTSSRSSP